MTRVLYLLILWVAYPTNAYATASTVMVTGDTVTTVRTALGFSTMLHFDQKPTSAVVGDQDAFKVEFISNSISVKPLLANARTNLFVFTEYGRYSFRLTCGPADAAQYSLTLQRAPKKRPLDARGLLFRKVNETSAQGPMAITVTEVGIPASQKALLVRFQIRCSEPSQVPSTAVSISQNGKAIAIQELFLKEKACDEKVAPTGLLVVRMKELSAHPVVLQIARTGAAPVKASFRIPRS